MAEIPGAVSFGPGESAGVVGSGPGGASASGAAPGATPGRLAVLGNPIARRDRPGAAAVAAVASASVSAPAASGPPPPPWTRSLDDGRMAILRFLQGLKGRSRGGNVSVQDLAAREQEVRAFLWHLDAFGDPTPELVRSTLCCLFPFWDVRVVVRPCPPVTPQVQIRNND